ncbi:integrase arm-type DNA-binding domain-containing protein [Sphingobium sp. Ndbn-10]|uniref:tyrosine-type recombinase/integrase n=1 Tax=Sphingobium sp. Ndbn-10 TaxID=1667223 RepID=UPI0008188FB5|nr:integrase arm-type DNA-binding domain-containing protein [Sphingobium sp. Ndbn-10]
MLTDAAIRKAKPKDKDYKLADYGGLYLFITKAGHRSWRLKYRFAEKEKRLVLGSYPDLSLAEARDMRDDAKRMLRDGRDPVIEAKKRKLANVVQMENTFEKVGRQWYGDQVARWKPVHAADVITSLERDVFPAIGGLPITDIDEPLLLATLKKVEARGAIETAHRLLQRCSSIFKYGKGIGACRENPAVDMKVSLKTVPPARRWPALTELDQLQALIRDVDCSTSHPITRLASRMMALTAQRPGMIRTAPWSEFEGIDWNKPDEVANRPQWRISASRIKLVLELREDEAFEHIVPLSRQAVEVLRVARRLSGRGPLAFPGARSGLEPLSENAVGYLYNRIGYKGRHVPHGWRSSFSTIMNGLVERSHPGSDRLLIDRLIIDLMLAHIPAGMSGSELIYNRAAYIERRRELAQQWADLIMADQLSAAVLLDGPRRSSSNTR